MNKNLIEKLSQQLRSVAAGAALPGESGLRNFQLHDNVGYSLTNDASITFNEIVSKVLEQKDFAKKFSAKYVEKKLKKLFAKLLTDKELDLLNELNQLSNELSAFNQENEIFLRIDGIHLNDNLVLGKVRLIPGDDQLISYVNQKAENVIKATTNTEDSKESIQQEIEKQCKSELQGGCVGVVKVNAEPIRAFEIAKEEVRRVIDLLRFSTKAIRPIREDIRIGLKGDHPKSTRQGFVISDSRFSAPIESVGSGAPFRIDQEVLERMKKIGVFSISSALSKKQANNLEEALIRSIHWFSVSLTQNENSNAFLFLIVSLESLFKRENGNSIGGTVAESVAFLMSDNLEGRKQYISIVRDYYGKRSGVAHGGNKTVTDTELYTLINIVGTSIMIVIGKLDKFNTQKMLMGWIEEMKLS